MPTHSNNDNQSVATTKTSEEIKQYLRKQCSYEEQRLYFLQLTAGYKILLNKFIKKYQLQKIKESALDLEFLSNHSIEKELRELTHITGATSDFLQADISARVKNLKAEPQFPGMTHLPIFISTGEPLPDGFYIRIEPGTRKSTALSAFAEIKNYWRKQEERILNRKKNSRTKS